MSQSVMDILNLLPWKHNELEDHKVTVIILATFDADYDLYALIQYAEHRDPAWKYGLFHLPDPFVRQDDSGWTQVHTFSNPWPDIPWVQAATLVRQYIKNPSHT